MINPGRLRHKINIQVESTLPNEYGEPTQSWTNFLANISASIEPIRGREFFAANIVNSEVTHRVYIRHASGVLPKMRVNFGSRNFDILSVINGEERNILIQLMCSEVYPNG